VNFYRTHPKYKTICGAMGNNKINRTSLYKKVLDDLGYPYPERKSGYYTDGTVFRGWNEFCGHCFMTSWGLNIKTMVKPFFGENYINDGLLVDYNIHWEHWGGLNKRNPIKKELYLKNNIKLVSTYDDEVAKQNLLWFYYDLKNKLIDMGVSINFEEPKNFNPLNLVKGKTLTLKDIYEDVKVFFGDDNPKLHHMSSSLFHQVIHYFGKFSDFIIFCNENFGESWVYQEKNMECGNPEYCVNIMSNLIKDLGRFPTASEMRRNGFQCVVDALSKHNGTESFKRNRYESGPFVQYVINILGEDNTPFDKMYDFSNKKLFDWAIDYVTKMNSGEFPKDDRKLRKLWMVDDVAKFLSLSLRSNGGSKYNSWSEFQEDYFGNTHTKSKRFREIITYEKYKEIRNLLDSKTFTQTKVIEMTNSGWGTVGRIKRKDKRFESYSLKYENELLVL
jgi:hypothetical protein